MTPYWSLRLFLGLDILTSAWITWQDPLTRTATLINASGPVGWLVLMVIAAAALVCVIDVLVNDFAPACYTLPGLHDNRHIGLMGMAIGSASIAGVIALSEGWTPILLKYWLDAAMACATAFLEMFARHRKPFSDDQ